eukprot:4911525-Pyramimonas_sp.AAC.1
MGQACAPCSDGTPTHDSRPQQLCSEVRLAPHLRNGGAQLWHKELRDVGEQACVVAHRMEQQLPLRGFVPLDPEEDDWATRVARAVGGLRCACQQAQRCLWGADAAERSGHCQARQRVANLARRGHGDSVAEPFSWPVERLAKVVHVSPCIATRLRESAPTRRPRELRLGRRGNRNSRRGIQDNLWRTRWDHN